MRRRSSSTIFHNTPATCRSASPGTAAGTRTGRVAVRSAARPVAIQLSSPSVLELGSLRAFQAPQDRFPPARQHEQRWQRSHQNQPLLPATHHQQEERGGHDQQRIQNHAGQGRSPTHEWTQQSHPLHQVPDPAGEVLQQVGPHEQGHQRQPLREMAKPEQQHFPGQPVEQDADPGPAAAC